MRSHFRILRRRAFARAAALPVLLAVGLGLTPATAAGADDTTTTITSTTPDTAPPSALDALAAGRYASAGLSIPGVAMHGDTIQEINAALETVLEFLAVSIGDPEPVVPDEIDLAQLEADIEQAIDSLPAIEPSVTPDLTGVQDLVQGVVDALVDIVVHQVVPLAQDTVPTPAEVQRMAHAIERFLSEQTAMTTAVAQAAADALLTDLATWTAYLTDEQHTRTAKAAVTTLLITLGSVVNPVPASVAPTAEAGFAASGSLVSWADELVQQQAHGESPWYGTADTDSDDAPDETLTVVDSDVVVAGEPVAVPGPVYPMRPMPPVDVPVRLDTANTAAGVDCGMFAHDDPCAPPMRWYGGKVIHNPIVRVVLVGSWWHGSEGQNIAAGFASAFSAMGGSGYQGILRQYYDASGHVGMTVSYQGHHIIEGTPPAIVSDGRMATYPVKAAQARGWKTSDSVVWVVALPPGAVADYTGEGGPYGKCGYQSYATSGDRRYVIAEVDYPRSGCGFASTSRASASTIAVHEYVGAVTNPFLDGWYDGAGHHLPDLCRAKLFDGPGGERV